MQAQRRGSLRRELCALTCFCALREWKNVTLKLNFFIATVRSLTSVTHYGTFAIQTALQTDHLLFVCMYVHVILSHLCFIAEQVTA